MFCWTASAQAMRPWTSQTPFSFESTMRAGRVDDDSAVAGREIGCCGCGIEEAAGSFGLIRKNSVSLFRCSENIERLINGTSDDLIHLVTMEAGLILQLEVLVKMLRCVVNVSQQLGKTASAIFYESLVSAPLVISAEEITHRLLKNLESGYGSSVAMLHVSEHGPDVALERNLADKKKLRKFYIGMLLSLHALHMNRTVISF
ncbi:hypothetical protein ACFX1T_023908 [Malus domestica]